MKVIIGLSFRDLGGLSGFMPRRQAVPLVDDLGRREVRSHGILVMVTCYETAETYSTI